MGAWDEGIMGSDLALDAELDIMQAIYGKYDSVQEITAEGIEKNIDAILESFDPEEHEAHQVLGHYILKTGAKVEPKVIETCIRHCTDQYEDWFTGADRRKDILMKLKSDLEGIL